MIDIKKSLIKDAELRISATDEDEMAEVAVVVGKLGDWINNVTFLRGLAEVNFFRTGLNGFVFALLSDGDTLELQARIPMTLVEEEAAIDDLARRASDTLLHAWDVIADLKARSEKKEGDTNGR